MKYKIIVDKQNRSNPSEEKREYEIDIEELHFRGNIYDSLIITKDEDYVIRRLQKNEYNVLNVLKEPIKEPLPSLNIELFEGDNYIYLLDIVGNRICAEYLVKNDFTDRYVTKNEMNSTINETAGRIEITVNQKLTEYATNEEVQNRVTELNGTIEAKAGEINLEVSKKVNNSDYNSAQILLMINDDESEVKIKGDKIDIDGKAVRFKTNISSSTHFTEEDFNKVKDAAVGLVNLTEAERELYDIDTDGIIDIIDAQEVAMAIRDNNGYLNVSGTLEIDPYSGKRTIVLRDEDGKIVTSIGLRAIQAENLGARFIKAYNLKAIPLDDQSSNSNVNIVANSEGSSISMSNNNGNLIFLQTSNENTNMYLYDLEHSKQTVIAPGSIEIQNGSYSFKVPEMLHGLTSITPSASNTPTAKTITFEKEFSAAPEVVATPGTGVPGTYVTGVGVTSISKTSFTLCLTRKDTTKTGTHWIAVN